ncbi:MAG: energy transducer TonB [Mucilaginibacter sp.]
MPEEIKNARLSFKCPVDYHAMPDAEGGKFCGHCQKKVYDFTNTKADIFRQILAENNNSVCGRFTLQQMAVEQPYFKPVWKKWLSAAMVLIGINLWEGKVMAQQVNKPAKSKQLTGKHVKQPPAMGEINIRDTVTEACEYTTLGVVISEVYPEFPGGTKAWKAFLQKNIRPIKGTKGRVFASFTVEKDGSLTNIKIERGLNNDADKEVLRVLKLSPKWKPGMLIDKPVETKFNIPVNFK